MNEDILHESDYSDNDDYSEIDDLEEIDDPDNIQDDLFLDDYIETNIPDPIKPDTFLSLKRLTKYERCRLLSIRTHQLTIGCPCTLNKEQLKGLKDYISIAKKELELGLIPLKISRKLQNNIIELI